MSDWQAGVHAALRAVDIELVAYLPDSKLDGLIDRIEDDPTFETVPVTREEAAIGVLVGAWVGGTDGALLCQSSGLANAINALASLSLPARVPFVGVVTRRGNLGEFNAAQVPGGYNMDRMLDALGCRNAVIESADIVEDRVRLAAETAFATHTPYIALLEQTVTGRKADGGIGE